MRPQRDDVAPGGLKVVAFNCSCREWLDVPTARIRLRYPREKFVRYNAERGGLGPGSRKALFQRLYSRDGRSSDWRSHFEDFDAHRPFRNVTMRFRRHDGREVVMLSNGTPTFNSRGDFVGYRGTAADITALRVTEAPSMLETGSRAAIIFPGKRR